MTLKDELGLLYRDMVMKKLWCDVLAEKETDTEKKKAIKGEAYTATTTAYRIGRMVSDHFRGGSKDVDAWEKQAREDFKESMR